MMDIVERLRKKGERIGISCPDNIKGCAVFHFRIEIDPDCVEAADEIERLREALKEVSGYVARAEWFYMTEETKAVVGQVFGEVK